MGACFGAQETGNGGADGFSPSPKGGGMFIFDERFFFLGKSFEGVFCSWFVEAFFEVDELDFGAGLGEEGGGDMKGGVK